MFIYFERERERQRQRQRQSVSREGQRERETQNLKQAPGSELSAQSPTWGSNSWAVRSWPELKSDAQPTEPPRCPELFSLKRLILRYVNFTSGHDLTVHGFEPLTGLWADSSEPGACFRFCVSLSFCPSPTHALSLCLSKINIKKI